MHRSDENEKAQTVIPSIKPPVEKALQSGESEAKKTGN